MPRLLELPARTFSSPWCILNLPLSPFLFLFKSHTQFGYFMHFNLFIIRTFLCGFAGFYFHHTWIVYCGKVKSSKVKKSHSFMRELQGPPDHRMVSWPTLKFRHRLFYNFYMFLSILRAFLLLFPSIMPSSDLKCFGIAGAPDRTLRTPQRSSDPWTSRWFILHLISIFCPHFLSIFMSKYWWWGSLENVTLSGSSGKCSPV